MRLLVDFFDKSRYLNIVTKSRMCALPLSDSPFRHHWVCKKAGLVKRKPVVFESITLKFNKIFILPPLMSCKITVMGCFQKSLFGSKKPADFESAI